MKVSDRVAKLRDLMKDNIWFLLLTIIIVSM